MKSYSSDFEALYNIQRIALCNGALSHKINMADVPRNTPVARWIRHKYLTS